MIIFVLFLKAMMKKDLIMYRLIPKQLTIWNYKTIAPFYESRYGLKRTKNPAKMFSVVNTLQMGALLKYHFDEIDGEW